MYLAAMNFGRAKQIKYQFCIGRKGNPYRKKKVALAYPADGEKTMRAAFKELTVDVLEEVEKFAEGKVSEGKASEGEVAEVDAAELNGPGVGCTEVDGTEVDGTEVDGTEVDGKSILVPSLSVDGTKIDCTEIDVAEFDGTGAECTIIDCTIIECTEIDGTEVDYTVVDYTEVDCTEIDCTEIDDTEIDCTEVNGAEVDEDEVEEINFLNDEGIVLHFPVSDLESSIEIISVEPNVIEDLDFEIPDILMSLGVAEVYQWRYLFGNVKDVPDLFKELIDDSE